MKPAICMVCCRWKADEPEDSAGGYLLFAEYQRSERVAPSHPPGMEYLCHEHIHAAEALTSKRSADATKELRAQFGLPPDLRPTSRPLRPAWVPPGSWLHRMIEKLRR